MKEDLIKALLILDEGGDEEVAHEADFVVDAALGEDLHHLEWR